MVELNYETFIGEFSPAYAPFGSFVDSSGKPVDMSYTFVTVLNAEGIEARVIQ